MLRDRGSFHIGWSGKASLLRWHLIDRKEGFRWTSKGKKFQTEVSANSKPLSENMVGMFKGQARKPV